MYFSDLVLPIELLPLFPLFLFGCHLSFFKGQYLHYLHMTPALCKYSRHKRSCADHSLMADDGIISLLIRNWLCKFTSHLHWTSEWIRLFGTSKWRWMEYLTYIERMSDQCLTNTKQQILLIIEHHVNIQYVFNHDQISVM